MAHRGRTDSHTFVNNQNTRVATVSLPSFSPRDAHLKRNNEKDECEDEEGQVHSDNVYLQLKRQQAGIGKGNVHPQLETIYNRIMRKLQRRANYDDVGAPPLATQLGVDLMSATSRGSEKVEIQSDAPACSTRSISSMAAPSESCPSPRQFPHPPLAKNIIKPDSLKDENGVDDAVLLSVQPCPKTLRLVVEAITKIVTEKLRIAEIGSIKGCLCQVFECRALLDRLLKEIPNYAHFQGEGERLITPMQLQELYQEFRKRPIVMPNVCYVRDSTSGRVTTYSGDACVMATTQPLPVVSDSSHPLAAQTQRQEDKVHEPTASIGPNAQCAPVSGTWVGSGARKSVLPNSPITIPASYGKTTRKRREGNVPSYLASKKQVSPSSPKIAPSTAAEVVAQSSVSEESAMRPTATSSVSDVEHVDDHLADKEPEVSSKRAQARNHPQKSRTATERCYESTQRVSVGVLTDVNSTSIVLLENHRRVVKYAESLEVQIEELKKEIKKLKEELSEEEDYTSRKRKVVQYLRETLYKECNVLRSHLSYTQQKQIHLQALAREQQMQMQQMLQHSVPPAAQQPHNVHGGGERKHVLASPLKNSKSDTPRFPSIHQPRGVVSESPLACGSNGNDGPRRGQGTTTFTARSNATDDREEMDISSITPTATSAISVAVGGPNSSNCNASHTLLPRSSAPALAAAAAACNQVTIDCTAVQSILDLVLLAVENDQTFPVSASMVKKVNLDIISNAMIDDPHANEKKLRRDFEARERQMKENYTRSRMQLANTINIKNQEIKLLKMACDTEYLEKHLRDHVEDLRTELRRTCSLVKEDLKELWRFVQTTIASIQNRARVVDTTLRDNHILYSSYSALRDIVYSASSLLLPMLTLEYTRGYHPWPLKLRNTVDPFASMLRMRYGNSHSISVREEANALSNVYVAVHQFVVHTHNVPQLRRPMVGSTLRSLCSMLVLNQATTSEVWKQVRDKYLCERQLERHISLLNFSILLLMYKQRVLTERSAAALHEAGLDMQLVGLPVQKRINALAELLQKAIGERAQVRKQRSDNARDVYRIWKTTQIDIHEGHAPPAMPARLTLANFGRDGRGACQ
ncbi:hypothetical protein ERJ75_000998600 [Trypanosoma vivax]|nr:hypothetical protein ERJ75_000998600 [Trypanosoma vivax]